MSRRVIRTVHVVCPDAGGLRWLKRNPGGATLTAEGSFVVFDEEKWANHLQAAGGKEVK